MVQYPGLPAENPFRKWAIVALVIAVVAFGGLVFAAIAIPSSATLIAFISLFILIVALGALVLLFFRGLVYGRILRILAGEHWAHWQNGTDDVYFSRLGLYRPAKKYTLLEFGNELISADIPQAEPPTLKFKYRVRRWESMGSSGTLFDLLMLLLWFFHPYTDTYPEESIVIPPGREAEARELAHQFQRHVIGQRSASSRESTLFVWGIVAVIVSAVIVSVIAFLHIDTTQRSQAGTATAVIAVPRTATAKAVMNKELSPIRAVVEGKLAAWKQDNATMLRRLDAVEAGFSADSRIKEVNYGYCTGNKFYVFVLKEPLKADSSEAEGYSYTPGSGPYSCHPAGWRIKDSDVVDSEWSFVTVDTYVATAAPTLTSLARSLATRRAARTATPGSKQ
jgi:hypothetical protein